MYPCTLCGEKLSSIDEFRLHVKHYHGKQAQNFACPSENCFMKYCRLPDYIKHFDKVHLHNEAQRRTSSRNKRKNTSEETQFTKKVCLDFSIPVAQTTLPQQTSSPSDDPIFARSNRSAQSPDVQKTKGEDNIDVVKKEIDCKEPRNFTLGTDYAAIGSFSVVEALKSDAMGKAILEYYQIKKELTRQHRAIIVDIVISGAILLKSRLDSDCLKVISEKIIEVFPSELLETYFIPAVSKENSRRNVSEPLKGKIPNKYRNVRDAILKLKVKVPKEVELDVIEVKKELDLTD